MRRVLLASTAVALCTAAGLLPAKAQTAVGNVWEVPSSVANNAIPANIPVTAPNVVFTAPSNPLSFSSGPLYTIGEFIASGGGIVSSNNVPLTDSLDNTLFNFTGTVSVTTGETFKAGHDDGLTLTIGGVTVISAPGGTSFTLTTSTYTGPSGNEPFDLVYAECCGPPAALEVDLPLQGTVPEPGTLAVFATGLLGLGLMRRRKHR
jgi:hypothetical protein